jgi:hypothetical protein
MGYGDYEKDETVIKTDEPVKIEAENVEVNEDEKKTKSSSSSGKKSGTKKSSKGTKKTKYSSIKKGKQSKTDSDSLGFVPHPERGGHTVAQLMQMQQHERVAILGNTENIEFEKKYL